MALHQSYTCYSQLQTHTSLISTCIQLHNSFVAIFMCVVDLLSLDCFHLLPSVSSRKSLYKLQHSISLTLYKHDLEWQGQVSQGNADPVLISTLISQPDNIA
ncbi:hypothetical protein EGW08_002547 [Elysia chlorotica]|uniref:Uncharacterized protein n=1 Tax=Elysia chlorotica TaxID=188477 RepID=A0A433U7B6_ELYCH|nr:hypothetical protein EGW08_002547 [Elysia chlorotica]